MVIATFTAAEEKDGWWKLSNGDDSVYSKIKLEINKPYEVELETTKKGNKIVKAAKEYLAVPATDPYIKKPDVMTKEDWWEKEKRYTKLQLIMKAWEVIKQAGFALHDNEVHPKAMALAKAGFKDITKEEW